MKVKTLVYSEYRGSPSEWTLDELTLEDVNLLVGKNATGKTRTLSIIKALAQLIAGPMPPRFMEGDFDVVFAGGKATYKYKLTYENFNITSEQLLVDGNPLLSRGPGGTGTIFNEQAGKNLEFEIKGNTPAVQLKRDAKQHSFLEELYQWAINTPHFHFGTFMGRDSMMAVMKGQIPGAAGSIDLISDTEKAVAVAKAGIEEFGDRYRRAVIADMQQIGFPIEDFGIAPPRNVQIVGQPSTEIFALWVQESGVKSRIEQMVISQGMFRAFSLFIYLNLLQLRGRGGTLLVDDVGEGLDFERASLLIKLLSAKVSGAASQLIMSTNDRFVMNAIPLKHWTVLTRDGSRCRVWNYSNSKKAFDEFKYTGLSNFDFFASSLHSPSK